MRPRGIARRLALGLLALVAALSGPATALAHGLVHRHLSAEYHGVHAAAHAGESVAVHESDGVGDHLALHCAQCATRTPDVVLMPPAVMALILVAPPESPARVAVGPGVVPPPLRVPPPDQPRAPPRG